jgi:hypothetical protein
MQAQIVSALTALLVVVVVAVVRRGARPSMMVAVDRVASVKIVRKDVKCMAERTVGGGYQVGERERLESRLSFLPHALITIHVFDRSND